VQFCKKSCFAAERAEDALALVRGHAEQLAAFTCKVQNAPNQGTRYNLPDISGTALNKSATRPQSATWKIGASASLLMATITVAFP
jgi:hypothetical protein